MTYLHGQRDRWEVCDFQELRPDSRLLHSSVPAGWLEMRSVEDACPVLPLPGSVAELSRCIPSHQFKNLRYYRRRAEQAGGVRLERAENDVDAFFDVLCRFHVARFDARHRRSVLTNDQVLRFHREAALELRRLGVLRLYTLRIGERVAAAFYGFLHRQRAYYYLGGFEPAFAHLSVGTLVIGHAIEEAVREGAVEFDFLRGQESYKYLWGAKDRLNHQRKLSHTPNAWPT
jgi:CelD/BcsL family acetyltransferase involved in cellulose biosynthesis